MADEKSKTRKNRSNIARVERKIARQGSRLNNCQLRMVSYERSVGTKKRKKGKKAGPVVEDELIYERFSLRTPVGYVIEPLRRKLRGVVSALLKHPNKNAKVEISLERFPQVGTVMGEINAGLPKAQRVTFGYTTKEEENTLFVIERAA
jgi:hypothetical protein